MPKGNIKRHTLKQGMWSKDLLEYLNKDLDALIFVVGRCSLILVDAAKSSLQQLSYTTCVSLIIPHCQKLRGLLKVMMIIRKSAMSHQAPEVVSQWDKNWFVMYSHSVVKVKNPIPPTRRPTRRSTHHRHTTDASANTLPTRWSTRILTRYRNSYFFQVEQQLRHTTDTLPK